MVKISCPKSEAEKVYLLSNGKRNVSGVNTNINCTGFLSILRENPPLLIQILKKRLCPTHITHTPSLERQPVWRLPEYSWTSGDHRFSGGKDSHWWSTRFTISRSFVTRSNYSRSFGSWTGSWICSIIDEGRYLLCSWFIRVHQILCQPLLLSQPYRTKGEWSVTLHFGSLSIASDFGWLHIGCFVSGRTRVQKR